MVVGILNCQLTNLSVFEILVSHGDDYEDYCLLGCDAL